VFVVIQRGFEMAPVIHADFPVEAPPHPAIQTRRYYAQVVVLNVDEFDGHIIDGVVDILLGDIPVGPGEVALAEALAALQVDGMEDAWVSCVWHDDPDIEDIFF